MNEDRKKRGTAHSKFLTAVAISALFLSSGNAMATSSASAGISAVAEQQQTITVNGLVVDATGEPIIGASVVEKGTSNGIVTDLDGKFTLNVKPGATLKVSFVGYQPQEVKATSTMKIVLKEDTELLDEVVVVGYGTQKKGNLTGAVATVDIGKTLDTRPIADVGRGLQGSTPGLSITLPDAEVGSDPKIKIRGQYASMNGGSDPLILLDNVEIPSITLVNPDDIESISVLKDAAASSIYGAKAAFGVILITTKKGAKTEMVNVSYSGNFSWQNVAKDY
ncbi:carboxypeptidase-like regulatory domain-containing protein, partial [Bacteroides heparinolyticus]|uniref:carboxypeptidase-like regulatory domain-containing protein n=1 Tax=Prevotella heparinolytica TaxID=28113 RepID=UPI0035A09C9D